MKMVIYKYYTHEEATMPDDVRFLSAAFQGSDAVVWAEHPRFEDAVTMKRVKFHAIMTGETFALGDEWSYIGTAQHPDMLNGSPFVVHVYAEFL